VSRAHARGVELEVSSVRLGWFSVQLRDTSLQLNNVPALQVQLDRVVVNVTPWLGLRGIELHGGEITLSGSPDALSDQLQAWRAAQQRATAEPSAPSRSRLAVSAEGVSLRWSGAEAGSAVQVDNGDPPNSGLDPTGPYYGIKEHADDHTIFVAGQAKNTWGDGDIDYVKALVDKFKGELCLDESRILATGFSMGGIMTLRVACNMADVFRAVAPMSCSLSAASCPAGGGHIAYWSSHGTNDTTINISNGRAARDEFAKRNGCSMDDPQPIGNDGCVAYQGCDEGYPVNWCEFEGIHEPPPFSGPEIWGFLSQF